MSSQMKLALAAAAVVTFGPPVLGMSAAEAAIVPAANCVNGVVVNSYPPVTCTPGGGGGAGGEGEGGGGGLPRTGVELLGITLAGGALLLGGGTVVVLARRRNSAGPATAVSAA